jgi:hypothetical protein
MKRMTPAMRSTMPCTRSITSAASIAVTLGIAAITAACSARRPSGPGRERAVAAHEAGAPVRPSPSG